MNTGLLLMSLFCLYILVPHDNMIVILHGIYYSILDQHTGIFVSCYYVFIAVHIFYKT